MRLAMIAQPRTGTTLLRGLLNRQSDIYLYGEVLYPDFFTWGYFSHLLGQMQRDVRTLLPIHWKTHLPQYLQELAGLMEDAGKTVVGFDAKIPQIASVPDFHGVILNGGFAVLHVRRRNTLAAVLSYETMLRRIAAGGSSHGAVPAQEVSIEVDPEWLSLRIAEFETQDQWINYIYRKQRYLEVWYEDFARPEAWEDTCRALSGFFGIPVTVPFAPPIAKQNSWDLAELITNSEEVMQRFPQFF